MATNGVLSSWTLEREALAKRLFLEGKGYGQIAKELGGVSRNAVCGKLHRLGITRNGSTEGNRLQGKISAAGLGLLPPPEERRGSAGAIVRKMQAKAPDPDGVIWSREESGGVSLQELSSNQCRWPMGPVIAPSLLFCAEPVRDSECSYCATHARRAFVLADRNKVRSSIDHALKLARRWG